jgi:hypothetical protein
MNEQDTLAFANALLDWRVPVIVCKPRPGHDEVVPIVSWKNITSTDEDLDKCREMLSKFEHGRDALALIGGHGIDLIDVDTKAGGSIKPFGEFTDYGVTKTPSGGRHYVVASTGLKRIQNLVVEGEVVGDYIGGTRDYGSRMLAFLPGSARPKYGSTLYEMDEEWDIESACLAQGDERVIEVLLKAGASSEEAGDVYVDESPDRDPRLGVHPYANGAIAGELARLDALPHPWQAGSYWDDTTFEVACQLIRFANSGWTGYSLDDAHHDLLMHAPSDDRWGVREHEAKWRSALDAVGGGGRRNPDDPSQDFDVVQDTTVQRPVVDVSSSADALDWCFRMVGLEGTPLAGLFRRDADLIYTPRVGESGYVPAVEGAHDGPAQVRRMNAIALTTYIDNRYKVVKRGKAKNAGFLPTLFPREVSTRAASAPELLRGLRPLSGVSHTPFVRADGSVLKKPGYDDESATLFLPDRGLRVPDADPGVVLLRELVVDFPFVTDHDRANYLGAMLTPLLRRLVPPPYPLIAIGAPQPGSGKSLLAKVLRIVHGGVFRSEMVRDGAEMRKQITAILDTTSAPVVTFDNLNGTLRSPVLDGLLTSAEWNDRILGVSEDRRLANDRLWTITGNNLLLGGDLKRRTIWVTIDPVDEHPELRTRFVHPDLPGWTERRRGDILAALLGMVRRWDEDGRPDGGIERTDDFGDWQRVVGGILAHAGIEGKLNHVESVRHAGLEDEDEWGIFLRAVEEVYGTRSFLAKQILDGLGMDNGIDPDALPSDVLDKARFNEQAASKSLGRWMMNRQGRWAAGRVIEKAGTNRKGIAEWRVVNRETKGLL